MMINTKYYEPRYVSNLLKEGSPNWVTDKDVNLTLFEITNLHNRVILLGNPGIGKTTELKNLFNILWKTKEISFNYPIYINIKNFRDNYKIEDILTIPNWKELPQITFLFDGLDEIANIQDFVSELELFITRYMDKRFKFVLSCRTNIFDTYLIQIGGFKTYFLQNLTTNQINSILQKGYSLDWYKLNLDHNKYSYLQSPFLLELFANYYIQNNAVPESDTKMWELFINREFEIQENKLKKRKRIDVNAIKAQLQKVSITSELMHRNFLNEDELSSLLGNVRLEFIEENPFLEILPANKQKSKNYIFRHRNLQEYFAAQFLVNLSFEEITKFVLIENTGKTHPTLFNTIAFLLNCISEPHKEKLFNWLQTNEPEILFNADSDKISKEHRILAFQSYFQSICIEKTLWINKYENDKLAQFADCKENFIYLLEIIKNANNVHRTIISALDILCNMTCPIDLVPDVKTLFQLKVSSSNLDLSDTPNTDDNIKLHILRCIENFKFHIGSTQYMFQLIETFNNNDDSQINRKLLDLIDSFKNIDIFNNFIYLEFLRIFKILPRKKLVNYLSGHYTIENLILRLEQKANLLRFLPHFFEDEGSSYELRNENEFINKIFEKCKNICLYEKEFIVELLRSIKKRKYWALSENQLLKLITDTNTEDLVINLFINDELPHEDSRYLISRLLTEQNLDLFIKKFQIGLDTQRVEIFRNIISNTNLQLALIFESRLKDVGVVFSSPLISLQEYDRRTKVYNESFQGNFNLLFEKPILIQKIKLIYEELKLEKVTWETICEYPKNEHWGYRQDDSATIVLRRLIRDFGTLKFEDVESKLSDEYILMKEIMNFINNEKSTPPRFKVSAQQVSKILEWTLDTVSKINFSKIILFQSKNSYSLYRDFFYCKAIIFFQKQFNISIPIQFYLNFLEYSDFDNNNNGAQFEYLKNKIDNKQLFNAQVIDNINNKMLHSFTLSAHISYALENKLSATYGKIESLILEDDYLYESKKALQILFNNTNDISFLKKCTQNNTSNLCWAAVRLLMETKQEDDFVIKTSIKYLDTNVLEHIPSALDYLFQLNHPEAITRYFNLVLLKKEISYRGYSISNYTKPTGLPFLKKMFRKIYFDNETVQNEFYDIRNVLSIYVNNLSKEEGSYKSIKKILQELKAEMKKKKMDLFYINLFISESNTSNINSKSLPLSFQAAKLKVEGIMQLTT
jgi:hypothetical protein